MRACRARAVAMARIDRLCRSLWRSAHGGAALEFGFLAPLLTLMLLGTIEVARGVNADRHFTSAVQTAGDLVAREEFLGDSTSAAGENLTDMMKSIKQLMQPYDATGLKLGIYSVRSSPTNASDTRVVWSYSYPPGKGMPVPTKCASYSLPDKLLDKNMSVIVVDAEYTFTPLFGDFIPGFANMKFTDKSYHSPRNMCVDYVEGDQCKTC